MNFEVRMRQHVSKLLEPIVVRAYSDRELIKQLKEDSLSNQKRLDVVEMAVYRRDAKTGRNTLIEKIEDDIKEVQILVKQQHHEQLAIIEKKNNNLGNMVFAFENRLRKAEDLQVQIDLLKTSFRELEELTNSKVFKLQE